MPSTWSSHWHDEVCQGYGKPHSTVLPFQPMQLLLGWLCLSTGSHVPRPLLSWYFYCAFCFILTAWGTVLCKAACRHPVPALLVSSGSSSELWMELLWWLKPLKEDGWDWWFCNSSILSAYKTYTPRKMSRCTKTWAMARHLIRDKNICLCSAGLAPLGDQVRENTSRGCSFFLPSFFPPFFFPLTHCFVF